MDSKNSAAQQTFGPSYFVKALDMMILNKSIVKYRLKLIGLSKMAVLKDLTLITKIISQLVQSKNRTFV